ncbi:hypothetical protein AYL99_07674 [Fonsecaea erecta]|uniref:Uncharacterized protein n=1 Tax=Fonsecaea erecta TaxID=1367422 RepID=A0A178ZFM0_9EURO|nr:hypothetical protein AYL99_07674 [Fonsecaea erecta]OAP58584.1 hypothetical protein AYL99_07674 [Fonsecaea erecta]
MNLGAMPSKAVVHFQPCLEVSESPNWFSFRSNDPAVQLEDAVAAQRAITSHYAAALVLSRIMDQVINRRYWGRCPATFILVFHEVDMTWFRGDQYFEERHRHPEFMPFWDSQGMQLILKEWRWIFRRPGKDSPRRIQVILPNIAWATTSSTFSEQEAGNMCVHDVNQAWVPADDPADGTDQPSNRFENGILIRIPGFPRPVSFPGNSLYARWLGMSATDTSKIFCFTVRGLAVGTENPGGIAVLERVYQPALDSIEYSDDPGIHTTNAERARRHHAVSLRKSVRNF